MQFLWVFLAYAGKKLYLCALFYAYMRKVYFFLLLLCMATGLWATPAERSTCTLRLVDGTLVEAMLCGDEYASWYETADGRVIIETEEGYVLQQESSAEVRQAARKMRAAAARRSSSQAAAVLPALGSPKIPVILTNFQDSVFHVKPTEAELCAYYDLYCNGTRDGQRYTGHGSYGAIRDYYSDQSNGQFTPEFEIIGTVTLDHEIAYYGADSPSKDAKFTEYCREALTKALAAYPEVDWMRFNNRGKNRVDMVFFVFAGCGQHVSGVPSTTLWPKWTTIGVTVNGITFNSALCGSENRPVKETIGGKKVIVGAIPDGIGVLCHEMNHALGLPDFYDYNLECFGMDLWSIMDYGQYGNNGFHPSAMTSYEREFMGWLQIEELTEAGWLTLDPLCTGGKGYKIVNPENSNEYYVIENRQPVGWDEGICLYGHGLMVTHVDYDADRWSSNTVNTLRKTGPDHQRMTIFAANNRYIGTCVKTASSADLILTWKGNMYPFVPDDGEAQRNDSLTAYSTPAAIVYTAAGFMNKDLHGICENADKSVSVYFGEGYETAVGVAVLPQEGMAAKRREIYDLTGRRVARPAKGVYIINGKKYFIK